MAEILYQTEGIILNRTDVGEADRILTVFTKDFGLLKLFARGVRRTRSKLNNFLNLFSYVRVGFVSGKDTWHLVDAEDLGHFEEEKLETLGRAANFIERFCRGEGKEEKLWEALLSFIRDGDELLFCARALIALGYLDEEEVYRSSKDNLKILVREAIARSQL
jgi:DNA repair protein RecO (recombination protein O)